MGDGEVDEPESLGYSLTLASARGLDNPDLRH